MLLALPPELRNVVYELTLKRDHVELCVQRRDGLPDIIVFRSVARGGKTNSLGTNVLAITQTSRAIRNDTVQLFYGINSFSLLCEPTSFVARLYSFRAQIGREAARGLKNITIRNINGSYWVSSSLKAALASMRMQLPTKPLLEFSYSRTRSYTLSSTPTAPQVVVERDNLRAGIKAIHERAKEDEEQNQPWEPSMLEVITTILSQKELV